MTEQKTYQVNTGFYSQHQMYRGESLFLAGLTTARAQRDGRTYGLNAVTYFAPDHVDVNTDGLSEDEGEFLAQCQFFGGRFKNRKRVCK